VLREHGLYQEFIGPRFLTYAAALEMNPIDSADRVPELRSQHGIGYCNITRCCTTVCPEHITITENAIIPLKERVVDRFYDLMELEPRFAELRAVHPSTLDGSRDKLFWFLSGWLGGPDLYISRFGHPRLRARHLPYPIGVKERDQWLACMKQAMAELAMDPALAARLEESFFKTADWMRNQHGA